MWRIEISNTEQLHSQVAHYLGDNFVLPPDPVIVLTFMYNRGPHHNSPHVLAGIIMHGSQQLVGHDDSSTVHHVRNYYVPSAEFCLSPHLE